jgi:hypothetical protein
MWQVLLHGGEGLIASALLVIAAHVRFSTHGGGARAKGDLGLD